MHIFALSFACYNGGDINTFISEGKIVSNVKNAAISELKMTIVLFLLTHLLAFGEFIYLLVYSNQL